MTSLYDSLLNPQPFRVRALRKVLKQFKSMPYERRLRFDAVERPHYGFCMYHAAALAKSLGLQAISVVEFGVAAGHGLVVAEQHRDEIQRALGIDVKIYGFDGAEGLPNPVDYRDMPYFWQGGHYQMDVDKLKQRLNGSELVIGDVKETAPSFFDDRNAPPIGAIFFDLDFYSSTKQAFKIFQSATINFLPRVFTYFDDMIGPEEEIFHEFAGELLAIKEFNDEHDRRKIAKHNGLVLKRAIPAAWNEQIYIVHDFDHPQYDQYVWPEAYRGESL